MRTVVALDDLRGFFQSKWLSSSINVQASFNIWLIFFLKICRTEQDENMPIV